MSRPDFQTVQIQKIVFLIVGNFTLGAYIQVYICLGKTVILFSYYAISTTVFSDCRGTIFETIFAKLKTNDKTLHQCSKSLNISKKQTVPAKLFRLLNNVSLCQYSAYKPSFKFTHEIPNMH